MSFTRTIRLPEAPASAMDFRGLDRLRQNLASTSGAAQDEQVKEVAKQFEALFVQQLMKQARQSSGMAGIFESDQTKLAQSMADEQMALQLSEPGIGLAQALLDQIQGGKSAGLSEGGKSPPELAASRLPGLRSRVGEERSEVATSISALLELLTKKSPVANSVYQAIKGAPEHIENFVSRMAGAAQLASRESGVPAKLILSQAALESGWGQREIKGEDGSTSYNLFGIKAGSSWKGKVVNILTTEYENGVAKKVVEPFRAYDSYADSFADYARLISKNSRYSEVLEAGSAEAAARKIQEAGYATDPKYADKLISIMQYFDGDRV